MITDKPRMCEVLGKKKTAPVRGRNHHGGW